MYEKSKRFPASEIVHFFVCFPVLLEMLPLVMYVYFEYKQSKLSPPSYLQPR